MSQATTKDFLKLHFLVLIWGFTAILGKLISIPAVEVVFYRVAISAVLMAAYLLVRSVPFRLPLREVLKLFLTGLVIAAHWILFFGAGRVANVSISLIGLATATLWTSILEPLITKRKFHWYEVLLGLVVISGLYIILQVEFEYALGLLLSVLSGLGAAIFSILNGQFAKRHRPNLITFWEMAGATVGLVMLSPLYLRYMSETGEVQWATSAQDWGMLLILAGICTVYAFTVSVELMKRITAFAVNLTLNLEPVYGVILALLFFGEAEEMGPGFYAGSVVIILAVFSYPLLKRWRRRVQQS